MLRRVVVCLLVLAIGFPSLLIRVRIPRPAPVCARHDCGCHGTTPSESCCCNPAADPTKVRWGCTPASAGESIAKAREFSALPLVHLEPHFDTVESVEMVVSAVDLGPRFAPPVPPPRPSSSIPV